MPDEKYDSRPDTQAHIDRVRHFLGMTLTNLALRAKRHDESKLEGIEREAFYRVTPRLRDTEYGTEAYFAAFQEIKPAIKAHYARNDHHPEHFGEKGVAGMSLMAVIEMVCDWRAASERTKDGDFRGSLAYNFERFGIEPQLAAIITATVEELEL